MIDLIKRLVNPYWEAVEKIPDWDLGWGRKGLRTPDPHPAVSRMMKTRNPDWSKADMRGPNRTDLVRQYSWAIPSDESVRWLGERFAGQTIVEIGAGRGYWASLLIQVDIRVYAYDQHPPDIEPNHYFNKPLNEGDEPGDDTMYYPVRQAGIEALSFHKSNEPLFLCWPPYNESFAVDCLRYYQGDTLIYIGEGEGGCTGDDAFFQELDEHWIEVDEHREFVQWGGIHDRLMIYKRTPDITELP